MLFYNNAFPKYIGNDYNYYVLIKFFPTIERQNHFLDGYMYMNSPTAYHDKILGEGIYDALEGATLYVNGSTQQMFPKVDFVEKDGQAYFIVSKFHEKPNDYVEPHFIYWPNEPKRKNVFCMYTL